MLTAFCPSQKPPHPVFQRAGMTFKFGYIFSALWVSLAVSSGLTFDSLQAASREIFNVQVKGDVTVCRLHVIRPTGPSVQGVLILMDGENLSPDRFLDDAEWLKFARDQDLAVCGVEMHSPSGSLRAHRGYYDAALGAGDALLAGLDLAGLGGRPIYAFGFSGGARFVASFVAWKPDAVTVWAAFSAAHWLVPKNPGFLPSGVIACGLLDSVRLGAGQRFFQAVRRENAPITWVSLADHGHARFLPLEAFVRTYFSIVKNGWVEPIEVDWIKETVTTPQADWEWLVSCYLPNASLLSEWRELNTP